MTEFGRRLKKAQEKGEIPKQKKNLPKTSARVREEGEKAQKEEKFMRAL